MGLSVMHSTRCPQGGLRTYPPQTRENDYTQKMRAQKERKKPRLSYSPPQKIKHTGWFIPRVSAETTI